ncbi:MAG: peptide chain release factor N(5)-glutamine methyltransferase [Alphaproteobacteria bacterium]|nr:peptide chain release factor N(5)-glutamine methyltransferase [Alphaproteobacteria bacterium]
MTGLVTIGACVAEGARRLAAAGVADARREARLILAHALGVETVAVTGYPERPVANPGAFEALIARRERREPLSHLTGRREFWSLEFETGPATLDPRPDSETIIAAALESVADRAAPLSVLDLGTGTGCLLLALLHELPEAAGVGVDVSPEALAVAGRNAERLGFASRARFEQGNWGESLAGPFDLIVCNPPYIPTADIAGLEPEVAVFEPRGALDGGPDGLGAYRTLLPDIARLLAPEGAAVLEIGAGRRQAVAQIVAPEDLAVTGVSRDLAGRDRCLTVRKR